MLRELYLFQEVRYIRLKEVVVIKVVVEGIIIYYFIGGGLFSLKFLFIFVVIYNIKY